MVVLCVFLFFVFNFPQLNLEEFVFGEPTYSNKVESIYSRHNPTCIIVLAG